MRTPRTILTRARVLWGSLFVAAAAIATACSGSTSPHQPTPCPSYTGGKAANDSLYGLYHLASYCIDTLPAHSPPTDTGHATLTRTSSGDSITAVFATQGQPPINVTGTYAVSGQDSIHLTGQVSTPLGPLDAQLSGTYLLSNNTLSVSGRLTIAGAGEHPLSFVGAR